jgi:hypothetical protein
VRRDAERIAADLRARNIGGKAPKQSQVPEMLPSRCFMTVKCVHCGTGGPCEHCTKECAEVHGCRRAGGFASMRSKVAV